jgi:hypothetical protein
MRFMDFLSAESTVSVPRKLRLRLVLILVRMWLLNANPRLKLPEAVFLKRFAAPRLVFILGMVYSWWPLLACYVALLKRPEKFFPALYLFAQ